MIDQISNLPIRFKIQLSFVVILILVTSTSIIFSINHVQNFALKSFKSEIQHMGKMVAETTGYGISELDFDNVGRALNWLKNDPKVVVIKIFDKQNKLIAGFNNIENRGFKIQDFLSIPVPQISGDFLFAMMPIKTFDYVKGITHDHGKVVIGLSLESLNERIWSSQRDIILISFLIMMASALLAIKLSNRICVPIVNLASVAREVANEKDYSCRAKKFGGDEIGLLADGFNEMLAQIQKRDGELRHSQEVLEGKVKARTEELNLEVKIRTHAEEESNRARVEAVNANRIKSNFLARMSHELRTPMNAILGFGQLMKIDKKSPLTPVQEPRIHEILNAGNHLLSLIDEVLTMATIESGTLSLSIESVPLNNVLFESISLLKPMADDSGVSILNRIDSHETIYVNANRTKFKQILLNLISNAIKYNSTDGTITIECSETSKSLISIKFSDTGVGIPEQSINRIFEPFYQLKSNSSEISGIGIGLSICKELIEIMNGSIEVESVEGKGSAFTIYIPKGKPPVALKEEPLPYSAKNPLTGDLHSKPIALYIDDNPANRKFMQISMASMSDIQLFTASEAKTGIDLARAQRPDVILMDFNLPGMNGITAFQCLKQYNETKNIPVIAISADAMEFDIYKCLNLGFNTYFTKSLNISDCLEELNKLLLEKKIDSEQV